MINKLQVSRCITRDEIPFIDEIRKEMTYELSCGLVKSGFVQENESHVEFESWDIKSLDMILYTISKSDIDIIYKVLNTYLPIGDNGGVIVIKEDEIKALKSIFPLNRKS